VSATVVVCLARLDGTRIAGPFTFARAAVAVSVHFTGPVDATVVVRLARVEGTRSAGPLAFARAAVAVSVHCTGPVLATVIFVRLAWVDTARKAGPLAFAVAAVKIRKQPVAMWWVFTCTVSATVIVVLARLLRAVCSTPLADAGAGASVTDYCAGATVLARSVVARADEARRAGPVAFAGTGVAGSVHFTGPVGATVVVRLARLLRAVCSIPLACARTFMATPVTGLTGAVAVA
jgi:hypothetical protein